MRKFLALAMVAVVSMTIAFAVVGCGKKAEETTATPESTMPAESTMTADTSMNADTSMAH